MINKALKNIAATAGSSNNTLLSSVQEKEGKVMEELWRSSNSQKNQTKEEKKKSWRTPTKGDVGCEC
jgi:hypothetical protein